MSNLRTTCRPYTVFSSIICCRQRQRARPRVSLPNPNYRPQFSSPWFDSLGLNSNGAEPWFRVNQRRTMVHASNWSDQRSPYETLGIYFSFSFSVPHSFQISSRNHTHNYNFKKFLFFI